LNNPSREKLQKIGSFTNANLRINPLFLLPNRQFLFFNRKKTFNFPA